jgi:hypothetical protein
MSPSCSAKESCSQLPVSPEDNLVGHWIHKMLTDFSWEKNVFCGGKNENILD